MKARMSDANLAKAPLPLFAGRGRQSSYSDRPADIPICQSLTNTGSRCPLRAHDGPYCRQHAKKPRLPR